MPIVQPPGGHAIYIDAAAFLPHLKPLDLPGQALVVELYREAGIRAVEIGTLMFGRRDPETGQEHAGADGAGAPRDAAARLHPESHRLRGGSDPGDLEESREACGGYRITEQAPFLRHFTAKLAPQ